MQNANYVALINAINCYDDTVLHEAKHFALHYLNDDNADISTLIDAVNASINELGMQTCWQHEQLLAVANLYYDEMYSDVVKQICIAMLQRSTAIETAFF